jgi:hypothetical protein
VNPDDRPGGCPPRLAPQDDSVMNPCLTAPYLAGGLLSSLDITAVTTTYGTGNSALLLQDHNNLVRQLSTLTPAGGFAMTSTIHDPDPSVGVEIAVAGRNGSILMYTTGSGGRVDFGTLTSDSGIRMTGSIAFSPTWKSVTAVHNGYFLFYDPSTQNGAGAILRVDALGRQVGQVRRLSSLGLWTNVVGTPSGGVLFYDRSVGEWMSALLTSQGQLILHAMRGSLKGFDTVAAVNMRGLLFYWPNGNFFPTAKAQIATLDETGALTLGDAVTSFPGSIQAIAGARNGAVLLYDIPVIFEAPREAQLGTVSATGRWTKGVVIVGIRAATVTAVTAN